MKTIGLILLVLSLQCKAFVVYEDTRIWNQDVITFYFLDGTQKQQSEVKRFAKLWEKYTGLKFKYTHKKPSAFSFKKYYKITFKGNSNESTKGAINGIIHLGSLSDDNIIYRKSTILHEFGHMLGLAHEHQRKDRPDYLGNYYLINDCVKNQKQSRKWCKENLVSANKEDVFVQSEYDQHSIMHYDISSITGDKDDFVESLNSLSYTDKYYIAMLYNQNISDDALMKMHKQDLWSKHKFEEQAKKDIGKEIMKLTSRSCKVLNTHEKTVDGKYCESGYMVISKDYRSYPKEEFKNCYSGLKEVKAIIMSNPLCQLSPARLAKKRQIWRTNFAEFGNCKRLNTKVKNNQQYYCTEGFSFVTKGNDLIGDKTRCYGTEESVFEAMKVNYVCNMTSSEFNQYKLDNIQKFKRQLSTKYCSIVKKKYKHITCPKDYEYTIIYKNNPSEPINNKCFANKHQAISALEKSKLCH